MLVFVPGRGAGGFFVDAPGQRLAIGLGFIEGAGPFLADPLVHRVKIGFDPLAFLGVAQFTFLEADLVKPACQVQGRGEFARIGFRLAFAELMEDHSQHQAADDGSDGLGISKGGFSEIVQQGDKGGQAGDQDQPGGNVAEQCRQQFFPEPPEIAGDFIEQLMQTDDDLIFVCARIRFGRRGRRGRAADEPDEILVALERAGGAGLERCQGLLFSGESGLEIREGVVGVELSGFVVAFGLERLGLEFVFADAFAFFDSIERFFSARLVGGDDAGGAPVISGLECRLGFGKGCFRLAQVLGELCVERLDRFVAPPPNGGEFDENVLLKLRFARRELADDSLEVVEEFERGFDAGRATHSRS